MILDPLEKEIKMKKLIWVTLSALLTACSTPIQQSTLPLDMKTVQEYQQRVASGKTATSTELWELNQSDKRAKVVVVERAHRYPSQFRAHSYPMHSRYTRIGIDMY